MKCDAGNSSASSVVTRKSYYVYVLLCVDGSYYTGYTDDVSSRFERHRKGYGARYTKMHMPKMIVHVEEFRTRSAALRRERQIKTFSHKEKYELISKKNTDGNLQRNVWVRKS